MRLAYLDTFAGISGDMFVAALADAGVSPGLLQDTLERLNLGARLELKKVSRSGIQAMKVDVMVGHAVAEAASFHAHRQAHEEGDHPAHGQQHSHRSFSSIKTLIAATALPASVKQMATRTFEELARAEAKIHGVPIDEVHFHEVGAVDAVADIVLAATAIDALGVDAWYCSPLNVGGGMVECQHGRFPVPAPATAELLRGAPTYSSGVKAELVTPTGAAIVRALNCRFGPAPAMRVETIGYGAGTRDPKDFPNVLRVQVGFADEPDHAVGGVITVIETAVDDLNPQVIGYVMEKALRLGALDVMCTPVQMKKNRPGTLITVLADADKAPLLQDLLLRETSSLGLRVREERRVCQPRKFVTVTTEWGPVRIKVAHRDDVEWNVAPEYEDCRALAESHDVPLKLVMESALSVYRNDRKS